MTSPDTSFDPQQFRNVLGHYPTGVVIVAATAPDGSPKGMTVGSFTSVSLDPPLVAFFPTKSSSTFPEIRATGSFAVSVLASDQEQLCRAFAQRGKDRFDGIAWSSGVTGSPIIDGALAWIDCDIESVTDAGDHWIVMGRVRALDTERSDAPLVFYRGGYGQFHVPSLVSIGDHGLLDQLQWVDLARGVMEELSARFDTEVLATSVVDDELTILGSAGQPRHGGVATRIGQRMPLVAPLGTNFIAWAQGDCVTKWIGDADRGSEAAEEYRAMLERVRERGWSLALRDAGQLGLESAVASVDQVSPTAAQRNTIRDAVLELDYKTYEPRDIRNEGPLSGRILNAPVFDALGNVVLTLGLYPIDKQMSGAEVASVGAELRKACDKVSQLAQMRDIA